MTIRIRMMAQVHRLPANSESFRLRFNFYVKLDVDDASGNINGQVRRTVDMYNLNLLYHRNRRYGHHLCRDMTENIFQLPNLDGAILLCCILW